MHVSAAYPYRARVILCSISDVSTVESQKKKKRDARLLYKLWRDLEHNLAGASRITASDGLKCMLWLGTILNPILFMKF